MSTLVAETAGSAAKHGGGYQNYSFNQLWEFIQTNPNKGLRLNKPSHGGNNVEQDNSTEQIDNALGIQGMRLQFVKPTGLLSIFTWISSPMFRDAPVNSAYNVSRGFGTNFIVNLDQKIAGTRFMRKKRIITEWMNTLMNLPGILTKDVELAVSTLCEVQGFHAILVSNFSTEMDDGKDNGQEAQIQIFFSSDPADWKESNKSIWIFDINGGWILEDGSIESFTSLSSWIEDKEKEGWKINWPSLDPNVKKTDMVELLKQSIMWKESDEKLKKDALAPRYVRYRTLEGLRNISYGDNGN